MRIWRTVFGRRGTFGVFSVVAAWFVMSYAPQVLAFPYRQQFGRTTVYSVDLITPKMASILTRSDALTASDPFHDPSVPRTIFLTGGGWRWQVLTFGSGSFALRRPLRDAIIITSANIDQDRVTNGRDIGGVRTLSGVIAHETTHNDVERHLGVMDAVMLPNWLQEGFADHVAQESSLSDSDVNALTAAHRSHPGLAYYYGRRRVAAALAANGQAVDKLFEIDGRQ